MKYLMVVIFSLGLSMISKAGGMLDWTQIAEVMNAYRADGSKENLDNSIRMFLLSSPLEALQANRNTCANRAEVANIVKPELIDILFNELIHNFPFLKPQKVGCQGFFCSEPIYTVMPNIESFESKRKWEELTAWMNGSYSSSDTSSPEFNKSRRAFKAYTLVQSIAACRLPIANWGEHANDYAKIYDAVEYTIDPSREYRSRGYTIVTGGADMIPFIKNLEVVNKWKNKR